MSDEHLVITGPSGGVANRLEINTLVKNDKFFSLYVQALRAMHAHDQQDIRSHFQLAGIHGLPYVPWNNATGDEDWDPKTTWGGYCTHGSVLFPTWHRPYMMLYEQILQKHAVQIADTYTTADKEEWQKAANDLRHPYWDWAANSVPPPEVISLEQVTITGPDGRRVSVENPLMRYIFHSVEPSFPIRMQKFKTTVRQPDANGADDIRRLTAVLRSSQAHITSSTYAMLSRVRTWSAFSSHTVGDGGSASNSIEAIHDAIHVSIGGHMSDPGVAAFDPIFWLHHCNVDRMLALWSAVNPDVWVSKGDSEDGSFTMPPEMPVDQTTPLSPFWNGQDSFWNSSTTRDITQLGYTYPEFNGLDMGNFCVVRWGISVKINQLYAGTVFGRSSATSALATGTGKAALEKSAVANGAAIAQFDVSASEQDSEPEKQPVARGETADVSEVAERSAPRTRAHSIQPTGESGEAPRPTVQHPTSEPERDSWDWTARIEFKKYEIGSSFSVLLFLGDAPPDPEEWVLSDNFIGAHHAFVNSSAGHCANCRGQINITEQGFVHLDVGILKHSGLSNLDPEAIVPFLTEKLSWKVQKVEDCTEVTLESLEVSITATPLTYPEGSIFPVAGAPIPYNSITHGKAGGARSA